MEYIMTKKRLEEVSVANLGPMVAGKCSEFVGKAKATGVSHPRLIIETVLKSPSAYGVTEVVYPIASFEWDDFAVDTLASYTPVVHVVDGQLYTAGI